MKPLHIHPKKLIPSIYKPFQKLSFCLFSSISQKAPIKSPSNTSEHVINFSGKNIETIVTNEPSKVDDWVGQITTLYHNTSLVFGLDCEWKCSFVKGYLPKVAVLQLCIDNKCLIFQVHHMDYFPLMLKELLSYSNATFVGVGLQTDVKKLSNQYGLHFSCIQNLGKLAVESSWGSNFKNSSPSLKDLASVILGLNVEKSKKITMSNWEARVLNQDQIRAIEVLELAPRSYISRIDSQIDLKSSNLLKDLAKDLQGLDIEKPGFVKTSDWGKLARVLTEEQIRYACLDAYATYRIACKLLFMYAECLSFLPCDKYTERSVMLDVLSMNYSYNVFDF